MRCRQEVKILRFGIRSFNKSDIAKFGYLRVGGLLSRGRQNYISSLQKVIKMMTLASKGRPNVDLCPTAVSVLVLEVLFPWLVK